MPATLVAAIFVVLSGIVLAAHYWLMPTVYAVGIVITIVSLARIMTYMTGEGQIMSRTVKKAKTGSKAISSMCCNNGTCDWCLGNKMHKHNKHNTVEQEKREENNDET